ncbi:MAG: hypothetical protein WCT04_24535 [Planctomycetota bacterium]
MITEPVVQSCPTSDEIESRFNVIWPELQSRAAAMSRRYAPDDEEAESEALASMAANFILAARRGKWLSPSMLAHYAAIRLRVGRTLVGNAVNDPLGALCRIRNKSTALTFSHLQALKRGRNEPPAMSKRLTEALTSSIRENPAECCATKLDWQTFVATQPERIQRVLTGLAEGYSRLEMAKLIGVSACRITQLMDRVRLSLTEFFADADPEYAQPVAM